MAANAAAALAGALYMPTLMTAIYNLAKDSPCAMRFQIAADGGWDAGAAAACLTAAAILQLGAPMPLRDPAVPAGDRGAGLAAARLLRQGRGGPSGGGGAP